MDRSKNRKTILAISHSSNFTGGSEDDFVRIISHLKEKFDILTAFPPGNREKVYLENSIGSFYIPNKDFPITGLKLRYFISRGFLKNSIRTVINLRKFLIKNRKIDFVMLNSSVCFIEALVVRYHKIPYIIFVREELNPRWFRKLLYKMYARTSYKIIVVSEYLKNLILKEIHTDKITILNAPIEESFYTSAKAKFINNIKSNKDVFRIVQIGALGVIKAQDITIKALVKLNEKYDVSKWNLELIVIGKMQQDNFFRNLNELISKLPKNFSVKFAGEMSKEEVIKQLINASCTVIASRQEGASLVFSESLFLEIPLIVSNVADLSKMVENYENGLIFEVGDYSKLADYLFEMITDEKLSKKLISNSKSTYHKYFSLSRNLKELESIFD